MRRSGARSRTLRDGECSPLRGRHCRGTLMEQRKAVRVRNHNPRNGRPRRGARRTRKRMRPGIVCGLDGSRRSWAALRLADALAARCDLRLTAVHIAPPAPETAQRELGERLRGGMRALLRRADVPLTIAPGVPVDGLVAASRRAALVVIGGRARGPLGRAIRGGLCSSLTRRSACPVIVAPARAHDPSPALPPMTLLCGVRDERDLACAATAACWAAELGVGLTLARALEPPPIQAGVAIAAPPPLLPPTPRARAAEATNALQRVAAQISLVGSDDISTRVAFGRPDRQLSRLADDQSADMIVVGSRPHGALSEALRRSPTLNWSDEDGTPS